MDEEIGDYDTIRGMHAYDVTIISILKILFPSFSFDVVYSQAVLSLERYS